MASLFISRSLSDDSPIRTWCEQRAIELVDKSLLQFQSVSFGRLPREIDWIFFYSPRAVNFFFGAHPTLPPKVRFAAIGHGTAQKITALGYVPHFVGNGDPGRTAAAFGSSVRGCKVLFPQARRSRRSVEILLSDHIAASSLVVYDNQVAPLLFEQTFATMIFTSPMNVEAFLAHNKVPAGSRVVALGPSTAGALEHLGYQSEQPQKPTEAALVELLG